MSQLWASDEVTRNNKLTNPKAIRIHKETIKMINSIGGLCGSVLDIGSRNEFTEDLEILYNIDIDSTKGDLDLTLICPKSTYDFVHYNNVIEHQFNPLQTLLEIKDVLIPGGTLILATPLKPRWITDAKCHFNEFDERSYKLLIDRSGFIEVKRVHFYYQYSLKGIRVALGSLYKRQVISILKNRKD